MGSLVWKVEVMCSECCAHIPSCGMLSSSTSASVVTNESVEFCTALDVDCNIHPSASWGLKVLGNEERACKMGKTAWKYLLKVLGGGKGQNFGASSLTIKLHVFTQTCWVRHFQQDTHLGCPCVPLPPLSPWPHPTSAPCWHPGEHLCHSLPHLQVCSFISISHMLPRPWWGTNEGKWGEWAILWMNIKTFQECYGVTRAFLKGYLFLHKVGEWAWVWSWEGVEQNGAIVLVREWCNFFISQLDSHKHKESQGISVPCIF